MLFYHAIAPDNHFFLGYRKMTVPQNKQFTCNKVEIKRGSYYKILYTKDRMIVQGRGPEAMSTLNKYAKELDESLVFDPFRSKEFCDIIPIEGLLGNFFGKQLESPGLDVIWDSGGYQIVRGLVDYIDPELYAEKLSKTNVSRYISIDPSPKKMWKAYKKLIPLFSKIQALNTLYLKSKVKNKKIMNVIHGYTTETRKVWIETCTDLEDGWGLNPKTGGFARIEEKIYIMFHDVLALISIGKADWCHGLAVFLDNSTYCLPLLENHIKEITADSSSAVQMAFSKEIVGPNHKTYTLYNNTVDLTKKVRCDCPACHLTGGILWVYTHLFTAGSYHNMCMGTKLINRLSIISKDIDLYFRYLRELNVPNRVVKTIQLLQESLDAMKWKGSHNFGKAAGVSFKLDISAELRHTAIAKKYIDFHKRVGTI